MKAAQGVGRIFKIQIDFHVADSRRGLSTDRLTIYPSQLASTTNVTIQFGHISTLWLTALDLNPHQLFTLTSVITGFSITALGRHKVVVGRSLIYWIQLGSTPRRLRTVGKQHPDQGFA